MGAIMDDETKDGGPANKSRTLKGQWTKGVSGNPRGRPRKKKATPKSLAGEFADAMKEDIIVLDAQGKKEMMPAYQAVARQLVRSIPTLSPKELIAVLDRLQKLQVFDEMLRQPELYLTLEQKR